MKTKAILYHLLLNHSLKELIEGNIFHCKIDYRSVKKSSDSIIRSFRNQATPMQLDSIIRLLKLINDKSDDLSRASWEMIAIISANWLVNEEQEVTARNRFMHLPLFTILDKFNKSYKEDFKKHCDFFESIVKNIE